MTKRESLDLIEEISNAGFKKITFAGGEPTLCDWLPEAISHAKKCGLVTMIITNGSGLTESFLDDMSNHLDWIGMSVDTLDKKKLYSLGRQLAHECVSKSYYYNIVERINNHGYKLKINTVVSKLNIDDDLSEFINFAAPKRWKLLQVLLLHNISLEKQKNNLISDAEFQSFCKRHINLMTNKTDIIIEDNNTMINSYIIIDPLGRLVDNSDHTLRCTAPILKVGIGVALNQINIDAEKVIKRKAVYDW